MTKLHILIIAIGSAGDVYPFLGLGRSFAKQGHRVSFCTNPAFQVSVERAGLRFLPLGTAESYHEAMNDPALWDPKTSFRVLWNVMATFILPLVQILEREVDSETVLVGSLWAFGARMMQEKYDTPYVSVQVSPSTFLSAKLPPVHKRFHVPQWWPYRLRAGLLWAIERGVLDKVCSPQLNAARSAMGLGPVKHILGKWVHSSQGVLALFPDWFAPPQTDWPARVVTTGFPLYDDSETRDRDTELNQFLDDGPPPIVFTPGSTSVDAIDYFVAAKDSLKSLGARGVFLFKTSQSLPAVGKEILVRPYAPLSILLPRARALVHHGGIGTASQALASGTPQLMVPFAHDQFDNAARVERLGCGVTMKDAMTASTLLPMLGQLLQNSDISERAAATKARVAPAAQSCRNALSVIEEVFRTTGPRIATPSGANTIARSEIEASSLRAMDQNGMRREIR